MRNIKNQDGMITMLVLITIVFLLSFLISAYLLISNKLKSEQDIVSETKRIYEGTASMDEIYNSYFSNDEIVPIYTEEQLIKIGSKENLIINGKYYNFSNNAQYVLMNDIEFDATKIGLDNDWIPIGEYINTSANGFTGKFEGNRSYNKSNQFKWN